MHLATVLSCITVFNFVYNICREAVLALGPDESSLRFVLGIFDDNIPEIDESFLLQISNPMGGVLLGTQRSVTITIQNNDDAHGLIGFAVVKN